MYPLIKVNPEQQMVENKLLSLLGNKTVDNNSTEMGNFNGLETQSIALPLIAHAYKQAYHPTSMNM